jgi:hypothetical protein
MKYVKEGLYAELCGERSPGGNFGNYSRHHYHHLAQDHRLYSRNLPYHRRHHRRDKLIQIT